MQAQAIVLLIISILSVLILGALLSVSVSLLFVTKKVNSRIDELDQNMIDLVEVIANLDASSKQELNELHETLQEQQRVHKSIRATTKLVDLIFKKPVVSYSATRQSVKDSKKRRMKLAEKAERAKNT
ncbi:MAG: hypothetical protein U0R17_01130 [Acidimicrobiia bacterium]